MASFASEEVQGLFRLRVFSALVAVALLSVGGAHAAAEEVAESKDASVSWRMDERLCGVNSTYIFLKLHDCDVEYQQVKDLLPVDQGGTPLKLMRDVIRGQGLSANVVRLDSRQLKEIPFPAIAHIERDLPADFELSHRGHYIVLLSLHEVDGLRYMDGSSGKFETKQPAVFFRESSGYFLLVDSRFSFVRPLLLNLAAAGIAVSSWWFYLHRQAQRTANKNYELATQVPITV